VSERASGGSKRCATIEQPHARLADNCAIFGGNSRFTSRGVRRAIQPRCARSCHVRTAVADFREERTAVRAVRALHPASFMRRVSFLASFFLLSSLGLAIGCGGATDHAGDDTSTEGALGAQAPSVTAGHYVRTGSAEGTRWIEDLILLPDGTFGASFGWNIGNLDGHHFGEVGTWEVTPDGNGMKLVCSYGPSGQTSNDTYSVKAAPHGELEVQYLDEAGTPDDAFRLKRTGSSSAGTLTFGGPEHGYSLDQSGSLTAGGLLEVHYATSRRKCRENATLVAFVSADGAEPTAVTLREQTSDTLAFALPVPSGHHLSMWFHDEGDHDCSWWDSDYGRNFHFDIH
jgi:hypothetical protein